MAVEKKNILPWLKKKMHHRRPYRLIPVTLAGLIGSLLLMTILILLYTLVAYIGRLDVEFAVKMPSIILFLSLVFGTFVSGIIIGGTSPLPGSILAGIYFILSLYQAIANHPVGTSVSVKGVFLKLLLLILAVLIGWFASWFLTLIDNRRRRKKRSQRQRQAETL